MKNTLSLLVLLSAVGVATNMQAMQPAGGSAAPDYSHLTKWVYGFGALALSKVLINKAGETEIFNNACESVNISSADVSNVGGVAVGCATLGFMASDADEKATFYKLAASAPLAAGVIWLSSTKVFRNIAQELPFVGQYFKCPNPVCQGSCHDCKLTKGILGIFAYKAVRQFVLGN